MATKISVTEVSSVTLKVSNADDENKVYDISARVQVKNGAMGNVDAGAVLLDGTAVATFSNVNNLSCTFTVSDGRQEILSAVEEFLSACGSGVGAGSYVLSEDSEDSEETSSEG